MAPHVPGVILEPGRPMTDMSWDVMRTCRMTVPEYVVHRALPQETVLLNVRTSTYHAIDEVGARFFEVILAAPSLEAASAALASEYEQPVDRIATDMVGFCADLLARDLIALQGTRG